MKKIILFSRVSTIKQDLTQQTEELKREALHLGYNAESTEIIEYKESGISLDTDERQGIQHLFKTIEDNPGVYDAVMVYEISRLSRKPKTLYEVRDWLCERRINLYCMKPAFRLLEKDGSMSQTAVILFSLFGALSESEMTIKKARMQRGKIAKRESGRYIGGGLLYGYKIENDKLMIDPIAAGKLKKIFDMYISGMSCREIASYMMKYDTLPYSSVESACTSIAKLMKRTEYIGIKGKTYDYPAIIDEDTFIKANKRLSESLKHKSYTKNIYYCNGLLRDADGKRLLSPNVSSGVYGIRYINKLGSNNNPYVSVNINACDSIVFYTLKEHWGRIKDEDEYETRAKVKRQISDIISKKQYGVTQIHELKKRIDRINERIIYGKMDEAKGDKMIEEANNEFKKIKMQMLIWDKDEANLSLSLRNIGKVEKQYDNMSDEQIQAEVRDLVDAIWVKKMGTKYDVSIIMKDGIKYNWVMYSKKRKPVIMKDNIEYNIRRRIMAKIR